MNLKASFLIPIARNVTSSMSSGFPPAVEKTEAYLGLSAFSMFLRRLRNPDHAGTSHLNALYPQAVDDAAVSARRISDLCMRDLFDDEIRSDLGQNVFP